MNRTQFLNELTDSALQAERDLTVYDLSSYIENDVDRPSYRRLVDFLSAIDNEFQRRAGVRYTRYETLLAHASLRAV